LRNHSTRCSIVSIMEHIIMENDKKVKFFMRIQFFYRKIIKYPLTILKNNIIL
jgi:hypothetical protein